MAIVSKLSGAASSLNRCNASAENPMRDRSCEPLPLPEFHKSKQTDQHDRVEQVQVQSISCPKMKTRCENEARPSQALNPYEERKKQFESQSGPTQETRPSHLFSHPLRQLKQGHVIESQRIINRRAIEPFLAIGFLNAGGQIDQTDLQLKQSSGPRRKTACRGRRGRLRRGRVCRVL